MHQPLVSAVREPIFDRKRVKTCTGDVEQKGDAVSDMELGATCSMHDVLDLDYRLD